MCAASTATQSWCAFHTRMWIRVLAVLVIYQTTRAARLVLVACGHVGLRMKVLQCVRWTARKVEPGAAWPTQCRMNLGYDGVPRRLDVYCWLHLVL